MHGAVPASTGQFSAALLPLGQNSRKLMAAQIYCRLIAAAGAKIFILITPGPLPAP
jgi:hypothetical protein